MCHPTSCGCASHPRQAKQTQSSHVQECTSWNRGFFIIIHSIVMLSSHLVRASPWSQEATARAECLCPTVGTTIGLRCSSTVADAILCLNNPIRPWYLCRGWMTSTNCGRLQLIPCSARIAIFDLMMLLCLSATVLSRGGFDIDRQGSKADLI